jgi:hypothetical protein
MITTKKYKRVGKKLDVMGYGVWKYLDLLRIIEEKGWRGWKFRYEDISLQDDALFYSVVS